MNTAPYRRVLGVQPEGVEPYRMEDVVPPHPHEPGVGIRA